MTAGPGLPLPLAVVRRLRTAETLRAELDAVAAERDALRGQVDSVGWERDAAQSEAAYLRESVLGEWDLGLPTDRVGRRIGLLLTAGDDPPLPPTEGSYEEEIALVSLANGDLYVRAYPGRDSEWSKFGDGISSTDFASLAERGPWVTVESPSLERHRRVTEEDRRLRSTVYDVGVPNVRQTWPESTGSIVERLREARRTPWSGPDVAGLLQDWALLAGVLRSTWESANTRAEYLTAAIRGIDHLPEWSLDARPDRRCVLCHASEGDHR